jgi:hypothetical protein
MRRRLATLAAVSMFVLALGASPALAAGGPPTHDTFPATDLNAEGGVCGYTFTSGEFSVVGRDPSTGAHVTAHDIFAEKDGASYKVVGSETYDDLKGHLTMKIMFVGMGGGIADSVNVVLRYGRDGELLVAMENDSCHIYG